MGRGAAVVSGTTITYLHCDGCGEAFDVAPGATSRVAGTECDTLSEQRDRARVEGWRVRLSGGRDVCGGCVAANG